MDTQPISPTVERLGRLLAKAREARGLSLGVVAQTVDCSAEHLRLLEGGQRDPSFDLVARLTVLLDLDLSVAVYGQKVAAAKRRAEDVPSLATTIATEVQP